MLPLHAISSMLRYMMLSIHMYTSNNSNKNNNKIVLIHGLQSHRWIYSLFVHVCLVCVIVCAANFTKRDFGWPAEMLENIYPALVFTCSASLSLYISISFSLVIHPALALMFCGIDAPSDMCAQMRSVHGLQVHRLTPQN